MHCNVSPDSFSVHEATIQSYNEQKGLEGYVPKIADQQCEARASLMETETSNTQSLTMDIGVNLEDIYGDAFTFCEVDNPMDPAGTCGLDE